MSDDENLESESPRGEAFAGERSGIVIQEGFQRFSQRDEIFCRSFWDPEIKDAKTGIFYETYRKPLKHFRDVDGFTQRDYSFRNASWYLPDIFAERFESEDRREGFLDRFTIYREGADEARKPPPPGELTQEIKRAAKAFGADLVGITATDERWAYSSAFSAHSGQEKPLDLPDALPHVIVLATAMDLDLIRTVPSALSGAATGLAGFVVEDG